MNPRPDDLDILDAATAEWLIDDAPAPGDVPPALRRLAALLDAVAAPPHPAELATEAAAVTAFVAASPGAPVESRTGTRRPRVLQVLTTKTAVAALGGTALFGAGAAAAATGHLPGPVQDAVHGTLSHIGVHVPPAAGDGGDVKTEVPAGDEHGPAGDGRAGDGDPTVPGDKEIGGDPKGSDPGSAGVPASPASPGGGGGGSPAGPGSGGDPGGGDNPGGVGAGVGVDVPGGEVDATVTVPGVEAGVRADGSGVDAGVTVDPGQLEKTLPTLPTLPNLPTIPTTIPLPPLLQRP